MKKNLKKILSLILAALIILGNVQPVMVSAIASETEPAAPEAAVSDIIQYDNAQSIKEEGTKDPYIRLTLTGEKDFPEGYTAFAEVLKEKAFDEAFASLEEELSDKDVTSVLPLKISLRDGDGKESEVSNKVLVRIEMKDVSDLKDTELYHQKADGVWEKIAFTCKEKSEKVEGEEVLPYVEFPVESFRSFLFVETTDKQVVETTDKQVVEATDKQEESDAGENETGQKEVNPEGEADPEEGNASTNVLQGESTDPYILMTLTGEKEFEEGLAASVDELEGKAYEEALSSLEEKLANKIVDPVLSLDICIRDKNDSEVKAAGKVSIQLEMKDISKLKNTELYHQKANGTWEKLDFSCGDGTDQTEKEEGALPYVEFTVESFSPFLFVETTDRPMLFSDDVDSISIDEFRITFSSGATRKDGDYVWTPVNTSADHMFVYRADYTVSGNYDTESGALLLTLPLHILKDRDGNWADTFECPYLSIDEVSEGEEPDFVYEVKDDKVLIYNYKTMATGEAGYVEFAYSTTKSTLDYVDMRMSEPVSGTLSVTGYDETTKEATFRAAGVVIDTEATINYTKKNPPTLYTSWQNNWGTAPMDAEDYYYLVWPIVTNINKNTSPYNFIIKDAFDNTDLNSSVVGYCLAGRSGYSMENTEENVTRNGTRYDYVLTRHSKEKADALVDENGRYSLLNQVTATVDPVDQVDDDTSVTASRTWWYEAPEYIKPTGHIWAEKYGLFSGSCAETHSHTSYPVDGKSYKDVRSSQEISNYTLEEFQEEQTEDISDLRYYIYGNSYPYPWTLADGADGTVNDALGGLYGQKPVSYELTDGTFYLEDSPLSEDDYDISSVQWDPLMRTAVFDETNLEFKETAISSYQNTDKITIWVRTSNRSEYVKAGVYDMATKSYSEIDSRYMESAAGRKILFQEGVKGVRFTCANAYYHTRFNVYPSVTLNRTDHVLSLIGENVKVKLTNEGTFLVQQDGETLFSRTVQGTDYIQRVLRESEMVKDVIATKNDKYKKNYKVTWRVQAMERYTDDSGVHYIEQNSGTFSDLLPRGAVVDQSSVAVTASGKKLSAGEYTVDLIENFKDSGQTLLVVSISEPTSNKYILSYDTFYTWNDMIDYGKNLLNSVAYETGNDSIADGYPDNGGNITEKDLLAGLSDSTAKRFLYAEARHTVDILMAANTGLMKQVKGPNDTGYSYNSKVSTGSEYYYQIRLANDAITESKDILFFDSIENFYKTAEETSPTIPSDWKGTLTGIDVSVLKGKGIDVKVYLSKTDGLNPQLHHDLEEVKEGEKIWMPYDEFKKTYGLAAAHAIAVDARQCTDGSAFVLKEKESLAFTLYMKAPDEDTTSCSEPAAYNNIYVSRTAIRQVGDDMTELPQFFHQDYTNLLYRVSGDIQMKKVDATDMTTPVKGAVFRLQGVSDYGTSYELTSTSNGNGLFSFRDIEKGTYELQEISCTSNWQINTELYTVVIDGHGEVKINGLEKDGNGDYLVADEPRIHANLRIKKRDLITKAGINGAEFQLSGTSDYGNDILLYATSEGNFGGDATGSVLFSNVERGTYELIETKTIDGYIKDTTVWTVVVDERGVASLYAEDKELESENGYYFIYNEPYHTVRFVKSSTYGTNIFLEGAIFSLTGVSDYGTSVEKTAVSASADDFGLVVFDGLEPGTYILKETTAPEKHDLDPTAYTVIVSPDGTFTIDGLSYEYIDGLKTKMYNFKNNRTEGTVVVKKIWMDDKTNDERWIPDITICTEKPSKNPRGYTITFDANGGTFTDGSTTNEVVYNTSNAIVSGTYSKPTRDNGSFNGWYTFTEGGTVYEIGDGGIPTESLTGDITVYAQWKELPRYAVSIYGIGADIDAEGNPMGLTFGPALGADYINSYKSHTPTGVTSIGNAHRCVHDDDWETIVYWNNVDPDVYEQCISEGCTKSVPLDLTKVSGGNTSFNPTYTGDGPSILRYELMPTESNYENLRWHPNGGSNGTTNGGWGASRVRAMLNGADDLTDIGEDDYSTYVSSDEHKSASVYERDNCLLAAFPAVLQKAIGARTVKYDSVYKDMTEKNLKVSYDKLWLFSPNELGDSVSSSSYNHPLEGIVYKKMVGTGDVINNRFTALKGYYVNSFNGHAGGTYNQSSSWWMRSLKRGNYEYPSGPISSDFYLRYPYGYDGISPGFSLKRE